MKTIRLFLLPLLLLSAHGAFAQRSTAASDEAQIRSLLAAQVAGWNEGSVEKYMHGYWESDSLLFIGKSGPTYGYKATLERYRKSYPDAAHMGKLTSAILQLQRVSADCYFIVGKWALEREAGNVDGSWTLLLRKKKGQWVIVADHSS